MFWPDNGIGMSICPGLVMSHRRSRYVCSYTTREEENEEIVSCFSLTMGSVCTRPVMSQQCHREKQDHESKGRESDRIICAIVGG